MIASGRRCRYQHRSVRYRVYDPRLRQALDRRRSSGKCTFHRYHLCLDWFRLRSAVSYDQGGCVGNDTKPSSGFGAERGAAKRHRTGAISDIGSAGAAAADQESSFCIGNPKPARPDRRTRRTDPLGRLYAGGSIRAHERRGRHHRRRRMAGRGGAIQFCLGSQRRGLGRDQSKKEEITVWGETARPIVPLPVFPFLRRPQRTRKRQSHRGRRRRNLDRSHRICRTLGRR